MGKTFYRFCKIGDSLIRVPMLDSISYTVFDMPFQNNLSSFMKG